MIHGARDSGCRRALVSANPAGMSQRRSGRHESAAIRRAWVSGDPAGIESEAGRRALSQRRAGGHWVSGDPAAWVSGDPAGIESAAIRRAWVSGDPAGIESAAGRRALSQRRAGGHRVRGGPAGIESEAGMISRERRTWGSSNPGTRQPAGGLGRATAGGGYLPRSAGMRARGQWTHGTRGDPAELPRHLAVGYGEITSGDFLDRHTGTKTKTLEKKRKTKRGEWAPLTVRSGLLSRCTHEGGYRNTQTRM